MNIDVTINDKTGKFGPPLIELMRIMGILNTLNPGDSIDINLETCDFLKPTLIGGLVVLKNSYLKKNITINLLERYYDHANMFIIQSV